MKLHFLLLLRKAQRFLTKNFGIFFKWTLIALVIGVMVGFVGAFFNYALLECTELRQKYPLIILSLPLCGIVIVGIYRLLKFKSDKGTNMVLTAVRDGENMTWRNTVSIFCGSVLTHLGGGSAGREGAALQIGGSIGSQIGLWLRLGAQDHRLITMCGMSAGFSALFGTPTAAAFFSMEVISVGIMHYSAIVPCIISALTGIKISEMFGVKPMEATIQAVGTDTVVFLKTALIAALCGLLSIIFCLVLKKSSDIYRKLIKNDYLRIAVGGAIVAALTFALGTYDYNGTGAQVIARSFTRSAGFEEFLLKLLFTALTLGAGYKGGEILPVFFVGSSFGSFFAPLIGLDCSFGAGIGLCCLFCGVTNCPITAVFLSVELFGIQYLPMFLLACGISYMLSGYAGLYSEQKIVYSKIEPKYIDKKVGKK